MFKTEQEYLQEIDKLEKQNRMLERKLVKYKRILEEDICLGCDKGIRDEVAQIERME